MIKVDKHAVVHADAQIGKNCVIGPFCTVGPHVKIGENSVLRSNVVIEGHTTIGGDCDIFPFVTIGIQSQDQKYRPGTVTYTQVGDCLPRPTSPTIATWATMS
jgi:UDP-N-acetylglucosamine acyltransferase